MASYAEHLTETEDRHWPGIDGLRTVAFLLVFFHHIGKLPRGYSPGFLYKQLNCFIDWGWLGVDLFFVISGFLIASLLLKERQRFGNISLPLFYARRTLRIWPAYFLVLLVACVAIPLSHLAQPNMRLYEAFLEGYVLPLCLFIGNFTMTGNERLLGNFCGAANIHFSSIFSLLNPLWSLCVEEQFYLFLPFVLLKVRSARKCLVLFGSLAVASLIVRLFIQHIYYSNGHDAWYRNTFSHLDPIMLGALVAVANFFYPKIFSLARRFGGAVVSISCLVLVATITNAPGIKTNEIIPAFCVFWCSLAFCGLLVATCAWSPCQKLFSTKILADFGKGTYAMYLWHYAVIDFIPNVMDPLHLPDTPLTWVVRASLCLAITYGIAILSWQILESRFDRIKHRFQRRAEAPVMLDSELLSPIEEHSRMLEEAPLV